MKGEKKFKSKRPSTYHISFNQTLTELLRQTRHYIGNCDITHLFQMKSCIIQVSEPITYYSTHHFSKEIVV